MNLSVRDTGGGLLVVVPVHTVRRRTGRQTAFLLLRGGPAEGAGPVPGGPRYPPTDGHHGGKRRVPGHDGGDLHQHGARDDPPGFGEALLTPSVSRFRSLVWGYYRQNRRAMPWRKTRNPYRILVSEVMLQQTSVARVTDKYLQFLRTFPTLSALAAAPTDDLLGAWKGLGYNRRALSLRAAAQAIVSEHRGKVPRPWTSWWHSRESATQRPAQSWPMPTISRSRSSRPTSAGCFSTSTSPARKVWRTRGSSRWWRRRWTGNPREWYYALMDYGAMLGKGAVNANRRSVRFGRRSRLKARSVSFGGGYSRPC